MTLARRVKRITCGRCVRPQSACICRWITPTVHWLEVVVLQHPLEQHCAKGSAQLLHLSLSRSRMVTGEVFAEGDLRALLRDPFAPGAAADDAKHPILLYPQNPADKPAASPLSTEFFRDPSRLRLIVIDGTWRKSRKMLHCNPLLQQLPRFSLHDVPTSRYPIRKAHRVDQLSTLEATCLALTQLEGNAARFAPLLNAFNGFVAQQVVQREAGMSATTQSRHNSIQL